MSVSAFNRRWAAVILEALTRHGVRHICIAPGSRSTPLTLADLAAQANLSEYHFARMFRQSAGLAPHQYVMQRRMDKAQQQVRYTTLPLTEIALNCGFSSASHFSNRFKAATGSTPSQLRTALAG